MNKCERHQGFNLTILWTSEQYLSFSRWHIKRFSGLVSNLYVVILRVIKSAFQIWEHRIVGEIYMHVVSFTEMNTYMYSYICMRDASKAPPTVFVFGEQLSALAGLG